MLIHSRGQAIEHLLMLVAQRRRSPRSSASWSWFLLGISYAPERVNGWTAALVPGANTKGTPTLDRFLVMPALVAACRGHPRIPRMGRRDGGSGKTWMAGTSPAMKKERCEQAEQARARAQAARF
jgi:hypothetical protein